MVFRAPPALDHDGLQAVAAFERDDAAVEVMHAVGQCAAGLPITVTSPATTCSSAASRGAQPSVPATTTGRPA